MSEDGLRELAHAVIEGVGGHVVAAKAVGAADDDFELVVEAFDGAGGDGGVGTKPIEDQVMLLLEGAVTARFISVISSRFEGGV